MDKKGRAERVTQWQPETAIVIAGPTASGKSAAALAVAQALGGEIINADALQLYRDLRILSARPSAADEALAPHHLYGVLGADEASSAGDWARRAALLADQCRSRGAPPILVGGTGLYLKALLEGLSPIPDADTPGVLEARAEAERLWDRLGPDGFHAEVARRDPPMARLEPGDRQRLIRAYEVFEATGRPLSDYQAAPAQPLLKGPVVTVMITPAREAVYQAIDARVEAMARAGAAAEAAALMELKPPSSAPILKAVGVAEFAAVVEGRMSEADAVAATQTRTRRYAKRQFTWLRGQTPDWPSAEHWEAAVAHILRAVCA
ncbi:MAG: tRNA (adenosine(37)-N6)-dimethylallyltransferase MiaA [Pseudomonadota bacterium]